MTNVALIFHSEHGPVEKIAAFLEQRLKGQGCSVQLINAGRSSADLRANTEVVIFGTPVFEGRFPRRLMRWVRARRESFASRRVALFTVSLNSVEKPRQNLAADRAHLRKWIDEAGLVPTHVVSLNGALKLPRSLWSLRRILAQIGTEAAGGFVDASDYECTNWRTAGSFATAVLRDFEDSVFSMNQVFPEHQFLDFWMPRFERVWRTSVDIERPVAAVDSALRHLHPDEAFLARAFEGSVPLEDVPRREVVAGLIGKFCRREFWIRKVSRDAFRNFSEPGHAVGIFNFRFESLGPFRTRVHSEVRIRCINGHTRIRVGIFWALLTSGHRLILRSTLRALKRRAENPFFNPTPVLTGR